MTELQRDGVMMLALLACMDTSTQIIEQLIALQIPIFLLDYIRTNTSTKELLRQSMHSLLACSCHDGFGQIASNPSFVGAICDMILEGVNAPDEITFLHIELLVSLVCSLLLVRLEGAAMCRTMH